MNIFAHNKKSVRYVAIIIAIVLNLSCVTLYAFADNSGYTVEIEDIEAPVAGELPDYDGSILGDYYQLLDDDYGYVINGITWYNLTDDTNIDEYTAFEADKVYKVTILIVPQGDNAWVLEEAFINGDTAEVSEADDCYLVSYIFGEYVYVDTDGIVYITGVDSPVSGACPDYSVTVESEFFEICEENFGYVFDGVTWFDTTLQSNLDVTDAFLGDHIYSITILLKRCEGCEIPLSTVYINGHEADFYETDDYYVASYSFVECADTVIRSVALELLREPVAGAVPCYDVYPDNDKYTLNYDKNDVYYQNGVCWYDVTTGANLIIGEDKFVEGHEYQLELYLTPKEHFSFNVSSATVNDKDAEIWGGNQRLILMCSFGPCKEAESVVRGDISSTRNTGDNEVTVELYELTREELFWSETIDEEYYSDYYIDSVPSGEYVLIVNKAEHVERKYYLSVEDKRIITQDIYIAKKGDCDMDGEVDVIDYQSIVNMAVSCERWVPYYTTENWEYALFVADCDEDGYVDALDCAQVALLANGSRSYDCVEVTGIVAPVAGELPTYTANIIGDGYELYGETLGYSYNGVTWYDLTEDTNLDRTDAFVEGHKYSVTIEVVPSQGGSWDLKYAKYNGVMVKARETSDCYLIAFEFQA